MSEQKKEKQRIATVAAVADRENRLADIREFVLAATAPKPNRFVSYDQLVASDLAWLFQCHAEAMELLTIGVEDGWDHYQLDAAKALVRAASPETGTAP